MQSCRQTQLGRIDRVLNYIHLNLDKPLEVASLARMGGWSRWQFNRVFSDQTGRSIGRYVRELRLSLAAEMLLFTDQKVIDIGLACGFGSDISFSRAFKQYFGCSPAKYRQRGLPCLLKTPLSFSPALLPPEDLQARIPDIRLDFRPGFTVTGVTGHIRGLFSPNPDFDTRVPRLWQRLSDTTPIPGDQPRIGVLDLSAGAGEVSTYTAGLDTRHIPRKPWLNSLQVPARNYVVISFHGPIRALPGILRWFFRAWLPHAGCEALYGHDLEVYPPDFDPLAPEVSMEYWIPVTLRQPLIARHAPNG